MHGSQSSHDRVKTSAATLPLRETFALAGTFPVFFRVKGLSDGFLFDAAERVLDLDGVNFLAGFRVGVFAMCKFALWAVVDVLAAIVFGLAVGCQPDSNANVHSPQEKTTPVRVWHITASDLHRSYREGSSRWTGQRVQVDLGADRYTTDGSAIFWMSLRPTDPPDLIFVGADLPLFRPRGIQVTGTVVGAVEDGIRRRSGLTWHILVVECIAIPLP